MNKSTLTLLTVVCFSGLAAHAETIRCSQTEPFISENFDTETGTVQIVTPDTMENPEVQSGLSFETKSNGTIEIRNADGKIRYTLVLNWKGSDGMSDFIYPYDAGQGVNGPIGCETDSLKAREEE